MDISLIKTATIDDISIYEPLAYSDALFLYNLTSNLFEQYEKDHFVSNRPLWRQTRDKFLHEMFHVIDHTITLDESQLLDDKKQQFSIPLPRGQMYLNEKDIKTKVKAGLKGKTTKVSKPKVLVNFFNKKRSSGLIWLLYYFIIIVVSALAINTIASTREMKTIEHKTTTLGAVMSNIPNPSKLSVSDTMNKAFGLMYSETDGGEFKAYDDHIQDMVTEIDHQLQTPSKAFAIFLDENPNIGELDLSKFEPLALLKCALNPNGECSKGDYNYLIEQKVVVSILTNNANPDGRRAQNEYKQIKNRPEVQDYFKSDRPKGYVKKHQVARKHKSQSGKDIIGIFDIDELFKENIERLKWTWKIANLFYDLTFGQISDYVSVISGFIRDPTTLKRFLEYTNADLAELNKEIYTREKFEEDQMKACLFLLLSLGATRFTKRFAGFGKDAISLNFVKLIKNAPSLFLDGVVLRNMFLSSQKAYVELNTIMKFNQISGTAAGDILANEYRNSYDPNTVLTHTMSTFLLMEVVDIIKVGKPEGSTLKALFVNMARVIFSFKNLKTISDVITSPNAQEQSAVHFAVLESLIYQAIVYSFKYLKKYTPKLKDK